jgi:hypothetical protein
MTARILTFSLYWIDSVQTRLPHAKSAKAAKVSGNLAEGLGSPNGVAAPAFKNSYRDESAPLQGLKYLRGVIPGPSARAITCQAFGPAGIGSVSLRV